jgi:hypothetical protein
MELGEIRRQASALMGRRLLSGLPGSRVDVTTASQTLRYNRAEGFALAAGYRHAASERLSLSLRGGFATGPSHPFGQADAWYGDLSSRVGGGVYLNQVRDVGVGPVISGAMNTVTGLIAGYDFTDPYFASGAELRLDRPVGRGWGSALRLRVEEQEMATLASTFSLGGESSFRPVPFIDNGTFYGGSVSFRRVAPAELGRAWSLGLTVDGGRLDANAASRTFDFARPRADAGLTLRSADRELAITGAAGSTIGHAPWQAVWSLGGRGTVPGYAFRSYGGDHFGFARATFSADLLPVFLRGRVFAAAGAAGGERVAPNPLDLPVGDPVPRTGTMTSIGAGVGILYDILRIDVARGLGSHGQWEVIVEANPQFWDFL